jgi:hypothetical protein
MKAKEDERERKIKFAEFQKNDLMQFKITM